jgi:hypothetical protein
MWVVINLRTRRLEKMPDELRDKFSWYAEGPPARHAIPVPYTKLKIPEVALPAEVRRGPWGNLDGLLEGCTACWVSWVESAMAA